MVAATYYSGADVATFMNGGWVCTSGGADPCGAPTADVYFKAALNKTALCGTTWQSRFDAGPGVHCDMAWPTAFVGATDVTGTTLDMQLRGAGIVFKCYLVAYDANGTQTAVSTGASFPPATASSAPYQISFTSETVLVPAGGFVALRTEQLTSAGGRSYWGVTVGGVLVVDEVAAVSDVDIICVAGSMSYTGQVPVVDVSLAWRTVSAYLHDSTGTAIPNGVNVICFKAAEFAGSHTAMTPHASTTTTSGTGFVTMQVQSDEAMIMVANMLDSSIPAGEVVITDELTPVL